MFEFFQGFILFLGATIALLIAYLSWKNIPSPGAKSATFLMLSVFLWAFSEGMYVISNSFISTLFWDQFKFIGIVITPVTIFIMSLTHTHRISRIKKSFVLRLLIIPVITLLFAFTYENHNLFLKSFTYINVGNLSIINGEFGAWFWVHTAYSYTLLFLSVIFFAIEYFKQPRIYRRQTLVLIIAMIIPWISNILTIFNLIGDVVIDITPPSFVITGLIMFLGMFRFKLLDLIPVAKEVVLESMDDGIIVLDNQNRLIDVNAAATKFFSKQHKYIIGNILSDVSPALSESILTAENDSNGHHKVTLTINKEVKIYSIKKSTIYDIENRDIGQVISLHDITELENIMKQLAHSKKIADEANKAKGLFLANMSHEIKTPMNGVLGMIDHLIEKDLDNEIKHDIDIIKSCTDNLLSIINDILDYSKIESGKLSMESIPFNLKNTVIKTCKLFSFQADKKGIELIYSVDDDLPNMVIGDSVRVRQILSNLISNAIKFTSHGSISVDVSSKKLDTKSNRIQFSIKDTGIGIKEQEIPKLFDSFAQHDISTTRKYGGTGLGLAIVKKLVQMMNGNIVVKSELGEGSEFTIDIPFKTSIEAITKDTPPLLFESLRTRKLNILVVEDNKINRTIISKLLSNPNWKIVIVENGQQALEKLYQEPFDLIFTDINMPIMDGYTLAKKIRLIEKEQIRDIPIIALTADTMNKQKQKCIEVGMNDFISKPIRKEKLFTVLNKYAI